MTHRNPATTKLGGHRSYAVPLSGRDQKHVRDAWFFAHQNAHDQDETWDSGYTEVKTSQGYVALWHDGKITPLDGRNMSKRRYNPGMPGSLRGAGAIYVNPRGGKDPKAVIARVIQAEMGRAPYGVSYLTPAKWNARGEETHVNTGTTVILHDGGDLTRYGGSRLWPDAMTTPKVVSAKAVVRALRGNKAPPRSPEHALARVAVAAQTQTAIPCSRFGSPGGMYLGVMGDVSRKTVKAAKAAKTPKRPTPQVLTTRPTYKARRVSTQEAHAIVRRGPDATSRLRALYWVPPELVAVYPRPRLVDLVLRGKIRPVWTAETGRVLQRGDGVLTSANAGRGLTPVAGVGYRGVGMTGTSTTPLHTPHPAAASRR